MSFDLGSFFVTADIYRKKKLNSVVILVTVQCSSPSFGAFSIVWYSGDCNSFAVMFLRKKGTLSHLNCFKILHCKGAI